jgi:hypothetical protein
LPEKALARQAAVAAVHWETFAWNDMSRPLSEWFRLSGACDAVHEFARAERIFEEAQALGALDAHGLAYVELSWARAAVMLAVDRGDRPEKVLQRLASNAVIDSVRWSAARWLATCYWAAGRRAEAQQQVDRIEREGGEAGRTSFILAQLNDGMITDCLPAAELLDELRRLEPGVVGHLLKVATPGSEAEYVARFYPY